MKKHLLLILLLFICIGAVSQITITDRTEPVRLNLTPGSEPATKELPGVSPLMIDVHQNIPVNPQTNENTFVVIIANENYRREVNVDYAINDGRMFKEYCRKTLGIPDQNIHYSPNATFGEMRAAISWITQVTNAFRGEASVIFFYAGHGMPDEEDRMPYLLPVDGFSSDFETAIKLEDLYARLAEFPAENVTVFLDACFSGSTRDDGMLATARAVRVRPRTSPLQGNMVVFSSATGTETAYPYEEMQHGMFTYFLLKKLQETQGDVDFKTLSDYIIENVSRQSIIVNQKSQTPQVNASSELMDKWHGFRFR